MKLHEDKILFTQLLNFSANTLNIRPEFIEKDYWLTRALQRLAQNPNVDKVVFKGLCKSAHNPLWTNLSSIYQSELTPLAFSEIPNEKLVAKSFIGIMKKIYPNENH